MKFSISASLALIACITPALSQAVPGEVYIKSASRSDKYGPRRGQCENTEAPNVKVTGIEIYAFAPGPVTCDFYKEPNCQGDKYPLTTDKGVKTQSFSKPFYAGSLICNS